MKYTLGLFLAFVGFYMASKHLNQEIGEYWDYVAFFVVIFATVAVMFISLPAVSMRFIFKIFFRKFLLASPSLKNTAQHCSSFYTDRSPKDASGIEIDLLNDGLELMSLGLGREKVKSILIQRFDVHAKKLILVSGWLKRNAKYPPAFGLAGTVLGLIHLMRGISVGIDTKETGLRMAVALVATFYGLIISNLVLNPVGEWLTEEIKKDEIKAEMAIETMIAIIDNMAPVEFQETLNSFLEAGERLDLVSAELRKGF